jgi:flagellin
MVVRTNVFALNAHRNLTNVGLQQRQAAQRLSSGYRINSAADDAAGLAISEAMRAQIRGLDQASVNAQDGVGLIQTAEGAMSTISDMVIRVRELMVQAANDTNTFKNREMIQQEIDQIMTEINDVTFRTQFNTRTLLAGGLGGEGGGPASPVSLQWMVFNQARTIGLSQPGGIVTVDQDGNTGRLPNVHWNENNRNQSSLRNEVVTLQNELQALARRVANRMVADPNIHNFNADARSAMFANVNTLDFNSTTMISISPPVGSPPGTPATTGASAPLQLLQAERTELQMIANRLETLLRNGVGAAEELFQITQDQINALGGAGSINSDGSSVFSGPAITEWSDSTGDHARDLLMDIRNSVSDAMSSIAAAMIPPAAGGVSSLERMNIVLRDLVGNLDGSDSVANGGQVPAIRAGNLFNEALSQLELLMDMSTDVLGNVMLESNAMWFQIGPNSMQGMILQLQGIHTGILGGGRGDLAMLIDVREGSGIPISEQLDIIDIAEGIVNSQRAQLGAVQNRLEFTRQSLDISSENLSAAESRIRDTDMAKEMMRFTAAQVLQQAGISMLAQANQLPASILQLLQ